MKLYFFSKHIPGLEKLPLAERVVAVEKASNRLTPPEKFLLNIIKLMVIVPAFAVVLRVSEDWKALIYAAAIIMLYPIVLKPVQYSLCAKYIAKYIAK